MNSCLPISNNTKNNKSWFWNKFSLLTHHNCGRTEEDRWTGMMTNCQLLQCVASHKNIKWNKKTKLKRLWSLSVDIHFNTHLTISLADIEGKERRASSRKRQKSTHIPACTQAVIIAQRKDSFCKTFHSQWIVRHTKHCVGTLSQAVSERLLNKLVPVAACALSLCLVVGPCAEMLVISPFTGQDTVAVPTVVQGSCTVVNYLMKRC